MLPGKLCIGILEEDNPLKSYFRLKPLLVEEDGKFTVFAGGDRYPEEASIRIVPDKNESSHFKARMRRMGRYCVLDLREHAGENDKIRPNKNYHGDDAERNAYIVYSDVVREPARDMIFEIAPADIAPGAWSAAAPGSPRLLAANGPETWLYTPAAQEGEPGSIAPDGEQLTDDQVQRFELDGFPGEKISLAVRLPGQMENLIDVPAPKAEAAPAPMQEAPRPAPVQEAPRPAAPAEDAEKPWISHDLPKVPPVRGNLSPMQQALAAQSGLNPRRNRSLQEIIEEKWRHSRVDQLGHPVPANAMGKPVENPLENPLEHALDALRSAWNIPEIHDRLVHAVAEMPEFAPEIDAQRRAIVDSALRRELEDMEAERLKTLSEIDRLRREKAALRETFKQEIRQEEAEALRDAVEKTRKARAEQDKYETAAREAKKAAEYAQDAFAALNDGRFEEKLRDFALTSRAVELLRQGAEPPVPVEIPAEEAPNREEWIARMQRAMAEEGLECTEIQAANLLICAALGDSLILSGTASSDKYDVARAIGRALGAEAAGRYAELNGPAQKKKIEELLEKTGAVGAAIVRDANSAPGGDIGCGLCGAENLLVIPVVSDGGFPLRAEALERGFMLRLEPANVQLPWKRDAKRAGGFAPVKPGSLKQAFLAEDAVLPAALERRLQKLREGLSRHGVRLSRHSLNLMWDFCAAMLPLGRIPAGEVLDLAFAQKALPCILAEAPVECLAELKTLLAGMTHSLALLDAPLPILI